MGDAGTGVTSSCDDAEPPRLFAADGVSSVEGGEPALGDIASGVASDLGVVDVGVSVDALSCGAVVLCFATVLPSP